MNPIGERMTKREPVENEEEILLKNENNGTDDNPKINYRGWKVMPFIIGEQDCKRTFFCSYMLCSLLFSQFFFSYLE